MTAYLLGVATTPAAALVFVIGTLALRRSGAERIWCDKCGWQRRPSRSRAPWWISDHLAWRLHLCSAAHRAANR